MILRNISLKDKAKLKKACEQSLLFFIYIMHPIIEGTDYDFNRFLLPIIEALQDIADYKTTKNLIVNIPPGWGKTRLLKYFLAWTILRNPNICHLYTSYSDSLIQNCSDDVKKIIETDFCDELWGYKIRQDKKSKHNWAIKGTYQSSGLTAASMEGTITGVNGGNRAIKNAFCGAIVIDDPQKAQTMVYERYRHQTVETFNKAIKNRKRRNDVPIILIMQRLDEDDLSGWILKNEKEDWELIKIPALKDEESQNPTNIKTSELIKLRDKRPAEFWSQYQQEPNNNISYTFKGIKYASNQEELKKFFNGIGLLDKGFDGSDSTTFCIIKKVNEIYYIIGKIWQGAHVDDCLNAIKTLKKDFLCGTIFTEKNDDKGYIVKNNTGFCGYNERDNKHVKIMSYLYPAWKDIIWHPDTDKDFIDECQRYNVFATHDDAPDCVASAIRQIDKNYELPKTRPF